MVILKDFLDTWAESVETLVPLGVSLHITVGTTT